ncbi:MAG: hypothetical protein R3D63_10130 [Paracoccaceae bacterium]
MLPETTALAAAGIDAGSALEAATARPRRDIRMTQAAEAAVLRPAEAGAWGHDLRAALAARIARLNGEEALAQGYATAAGAHVALADPAARGEGVTAAVLGFMDKVAARTREVAAGDIAALQATGIADPDIVRLCELNAFLAYQIRVIQGLRLLKGLAA